MAIFSLTFKGLMGFVPRLIDTKKGMTVLLPTSDRPRFSDSSSTRDLLSRHYPFLRIEKKYLANGSPRQADFVVVQKNYEEAFVFVSGEELSVSTGIQPSGLVEFYEPTAKDLDRPDINASPDLNKLQSQDIKWLAEMEKAYPKAGVIDSDCLGPNLEGLVASRLTVVDGVLRVSKLSQQRIVGGKINAPRFEFVATVVAPRVFQALSEEIALDVASTDVVVISSKDMATGMPRELIFLQSVDGKIEVTLHNSELEEIIGPVLGVQPVGQPIDFELLYELCASKVPLSGRRTPSVRDGGAGDRICPGGKFLLPTSDIATVEKEV